MISINKGKGERECQYCNAPVVTSSAVPMCENCAKAFEAKIAADKAVKAEADSKTSLAHAQIDVFMRGCATQQQAAAVVDNLLARFGGAEGFAEQWYGQMNHILTNASGSQKAINMMRDFAKFMLQVSKVSMEQLSQIDDMDMAELEERLEPIHRKMGIVDDNGERRSA